jgi:hypothetical protein
MFFGDVAKVIEYDSGLDAGDAARRIDLKNLCHVLGEVENDRNVAALSGKRGASATTEERRAKLSAERDRGKYIVNLARKDDADGDLAVVGAVGRVKSTAAGIEPDLTANLRAQRLGKSGRVHSRRICRLPNLHKVVWHGPGF